MNIYMYTYTLGQVCFGSLYQNVQPVLISVRGQPCRGLPTLRPLDISLVLQIYIHAIFPVNAYIFCVLCRFYYYHYKINIK